MSRRIQARRSNGRFTPNTPENTFGLHVPICPACGAFNPYPVAERDPASGFPLPATPPTNCHRCGAELHPAPLANDVLPKVTGYLAGVDPSEFTE